MAAIKQTETRSKQAGTLFKKKHLVSLFAWLEEGSLLTQCVFHKHRKQLGNADDYRYLIY